MPKVIYHFNGKKISYRKFKKVLMSIIKEMNDDNMTMDALNEYIHSQHTIYYYDNKKVKVIHNFDLVITIENFKKSEV